MDKILHTKLGPGLDFDPLEEKQEVNAVASNDGVMPDVVLEEIKKYKYKCSNPYCRRWNELAYMEHTKVVCEFCGIIAKTRKQA